MFIILNRSLASGHFARFCGIDLSYISINSYHRYAAKFSFNAVPVSLLNFWLIPRNELLHNARTPSDQKIPKTKHISSATCTWCTTFWNQDARTPVSRSRTRVVPDAHKHSHPSRPQLGRPSPWDWYQRGSYQLGLVDEL